MWEFTVEIQIKYFINISLFGDLIRHFYFKKKNTLLEDLAESKIVVCDRSFEK